MESTPTTALATDHHEHTLALEWVKSATWRFVFAEEMQKAVSLALVAGVNLVFSGPGGHAKSEFLSAVTAAIQDTEPFVKSFGQGTSTEELYGGIDLDAMHGRNGQQSALQFNTKHSFLPHKVAVFEELFDAPARVLTSLKDTLTAGMLRNGHQQCDMATTMIAAATNHSPQEIAEGGPEIAALVERFPIQVKVEWPRYDEDALMAMFGTALVQNPLEPMRVSWSEIAKMQKSVEEVEVPRLMQRLLARIVQELWRDGVTLSPRTVIQGMRLTRAAAVINGRSRVVVQDLRALAFLPGLHALRERVHSLIEELYAPLQGEEGLESCVAKSHDLRKQAEGMGTLDELMHVIGSLKALKDDIRAMPFTSEQLTRRNKALQQVDDVIAPIQNRVNTMQKAHSLEVCRPRLEEIRLKVKKITNQAKHMDASRRAQARLTLKGLEGEVQFMNVPSELYGARAGVLTNIQMAQSVLNGV